MSMSFYRRHRRKGAPRTTSAPIRTGFLAKLTQRRANARAAFEASERAEAELRSRSAAEAAEAAATAEATRATANGTSERTPEEADDATLFAAAEAADNNLTVLSPDRKAAPPTPTPPTRSCVVCGKAAESHCGRCKVSYCSRECQAWHWKAGHKQQCRGNRAAATPRPRLPDQLEGVGKQNDAASFHRERSLAEVMEALAFTDEAEARAFLRRAGYNTATTTAEGGGGESDRTEGTGGGGVQFGRNAAVREQLVAEIDYRCGVPSAPAAPPRPPPPPLAAANPRAGASPRTLR